MPAQKLVWSKVFRTQGKAKVLVEVGIGDGQRGAASFVWDRTGRQGEEWDDAIPEDRVLQIDLGPGDKVPFSVLSGVVLVKQVNPLTRRMSVDCRVYQRGHEQDAITRVLRTPNEDGEAIVAFALRVTFRNGSAT